METLNLILDFVLIIASVWMVTIVAGYGGMIGKAFTLIGWGAIILGIAHFVETITFKLLGLSPELVELTHRLIVLAGFMLIVFGFRMFVRQK